MLFQRRKLDTYELNFVIIFFKGRVFILPAGIHIFINLLYLLPQNVANDVTKIINNMCNTK